MCATRLPRFSCKKTSNVHPHSRLINSRKIFHLFYGALTQFSAKKSVMPKILELKNFFAEFNFQSSSFRRTAKGNKHFALLAVHFGG